MERKIRKWLFGLILLLFAVIILPFIVSPIVNNILLQNFDKQLKKYPLPAQTDFVEQKSICGKLNGNGNGMNFLSSILVQSDLSIDELKEYYADATFKPIINKQYDVEVEVLPANGHKLESKYLEHGNIYFESLKNREATNFYIVIIYHGGYWGGFDIRAN